VIVWINGAHGVGKTTTAALVQEPVAGSRILDAEKAGTALTPAGAAALITRTAASGR
jgi:dephospho-CoA kinase